MKLVYLGTPAFAVPTLERIVASGHGVAAVYTQPDRPKGRGQKLTAPPVKEAALRLGLPIRQPERIKTAESVQELREFSPEVMVVVGYGQILPQAVLDIPPHGILNVHASLLPKYRGAAPIQWAVANGETTTGVTIMKIDAGLDTGDMLLKRETEIGDDDAERLGSRLATMGADLLVEALEKLQELRAEPQDHALATYAPILKKEDGHIQWSSSSRAILNRIRGLQPWPGCYGFLRGERFHIWSAKGSAEKVEVGHLKEQAGRLAVGCGDGAIELTEVQLQGKKRMPAKAFLNGFNLREGETLA